jgi:hypothetical protein
MTQTTRLALFAIGALLMCVPGLFTAGMRWAFVAFLAVGYATLIVATVKSGGSRPGTALTLLIASNVSFWFSLGLAVIRIKVVGPSLLGGVDAFAGPAALWLYLLPTIILYEAIVFLRGVVANRERTVAAIGLIAAVVQVLVTLRFVYRMVQGV